MCKKSLLRQQQCIDQMYPLQVNVHLHAQIDHPELGHIVHPESLVDDCCPIGGWAHFSRPGRMYARHRVVLHIAPQMLNRCHWVAIALVRGHTQELAASLPERFGEHELLLLYHCLDQRIQVVVVPEKKFASTAGTSCADVPFSRT